MGGTHKQHAYFGGLHSCAGPYSKSCLENAGDTDKGLGRHQVRRAPVVWWYRPPWGVWVGLNAEKAGWA